MAKEIDDLKMMVEQLKAELKLMQNIDILSTRHGVECKDVGMQFSYLQPVSGIVLPYVIVTYMYSIDNLREVTVVAEKLFTIAGDCSQVFHWEKYGFKMSVPQGSLEANSTCDVAFKAIAHGQFQFPKNTQLVSGVYAIAMTRKLLQPATIEVEHCVHLKSIEQCSRLSFAKAYCTQKDLPYTFEPLKGGHFIPESNVGRISLSRFSQVAIVQEGVSPGSDHVYLSQLLQYHMSLQPPEWFIVFLVTKGLKLTAEVTNHVYYV